MAIVATNTEQYEEAFKKLFPKGDYWDKQFADPQSDVSLFCRAKLPEFIRFRHQMAALLNESKIQSATELLDDWERVLLGAVFSGLDVQQRRVVLQQQNNTKITDAEMKDTAKIFGFIITDIRMPYRPAFFGFARFGTDNIHTPAAWHVMHIFVNTQGNNEQKEQFEAEIKKKLLANHIPYFFYDGGNS